MNTNAFIQLFTKPGEPLQQAEVNIPPLKRGEILVKCLYTTLCGSDLHTFTGVRHEKTPTILGHEIVGEIIQLAASEMMMDCLQQPLVVGDRITWSIYASDPFDPRAQAGMPQKVEPIYKYGHRQHTEEDGLNGGLATHLILREHTATIKVDPTIPLPVVAPLNCAFSTVAGALRLAGCLNGKEVLVTGMGLLGLVTVAMAKARGAVRVFVSDPSTERLQLAKAFGADHVLAYSDSRDVDIAIDMSGAKAAMELGLSNLKVGGRAVWVGCVFPQEAIQVDAQAIVRGLLTIQGLHNYNTEDFRQAYHFIDKHWRKFPLQEVVGREFTLDQAEQAFEYAITQRPLRVGIYMNSSIQQR